ncbi:carbohydrate-binding protein [Spongiactinospora sp. 9N601]|uniref:carbohydrate-binding protein n=1 Tax=Spongiactinospora sp. 9N601 TaxID=3375149 RepID=UPI0037B564D6
MKIRHTAISLLTGLALAGGAYVATAAPAGAAVHASYEEWTPGKHYKPPFCRIVYGGVEYECVVEHTAWPGFEPPNVPALWRRV